MSGPLDFPPFRKDLVDQLSDQIASYDGDAKKTSPIIELTQSLIDTIRRDVGPSKELLARIEVILFPKLGRLYEEDSIDSKMDELFEIVRNKESSIDKATFNKEMIKVRIQRVSEDPSIRDDSLLDSAKELYNSGYLKDKNDLLIIKYIIKNISPYDSILTDSSEFIENLSVETAYETLSFIIEKKAAFFMRNTRLIFEKLSIPQSDLLQPILTQNQFVDLFLSQQNGWNSISHLIPILLELSEGAISVFFKTFSSDERTSAAFTEAVLNKLQLLITTPPMHREPITPSTMHFLIHAFELIRDKVEVFEHLEKLEILSPEVTHMREFAQLKEKVAVEKALQLSTDPIKKDLDEHSGHLWRCISKRLDPTGKGYLYDFEAKYHPDMGGLERLINIKIYPAVEYTSHELYNLIRLQKDKSDPVVTFLNDLGYSFTDHGSSLRMTFPDKNALMATYIKYKEEHPELDLPQLDIISSPGIATDLDFINLLIAHDGLISDEKEFIHDNTSHIWPLLVRAFLGSSKFNEIKETTVGMYKAYREKIERSQAELGQYLPIIQTVLGAYVDTMSNRADEGVFSLNNILKDPDWVRYLKIRYSQKVHDESSEPKPPVFNRETIPEIERLVAIIEEG